MRKLFFLSLALAVVAPAQAFIQIDLVASPAPNVFGSSNYQTWFDNAQDALRAGANTAGSGFSFYENVSGTTRNVYEAAVTGFNSWQGVADVTSEHGQRMHFVYRIYDSNDTDVMLSQIKGITFSGNWRDGSSDSFGPFDFDGSTTFDVTRRVGFLADGTRITSGNQAVKQIIGTFGLAYEPDLATGTNQEKLDDLLATMADPNTGLANIRASLGYQVIGGGLTTESQFVNFAPVPEPATMAVLGLGIAGLIRRRRNRA